MNRWMMVVFVALCTTGRVLAQTALGLPVDGVKTIWLNDQVGKNQVQFVSAAPMEEIRGTAMGVSGKVVIDPQNLEAMTGHIEVSVAQMETGIKKRDEHLRSKDWLHADAFPVIVFDITGLKNITVKTDAGKAILKGIATGHFLLHGVTKPLDIPFDGTYLLSSEQTQKRAPGDFFVIQGHFKIALKDFEIEGARGMVGSRVGTEIDLKANFFGSSEKQTDKE